MQGNRTGGPTVALLLVIGSLLALSGHILHPKVELTAANIVAHEEWRVVHLVAGLGYALLGAGALALLVTHSTQRAALATFVIGTAALIGTLAVDGGAGPVLARSVTAGGDDTALHAIHELQRISGSIGFALVGIGGTAYAWTEARGATRGWRIGAVLGAIGFAAIAGAGLFVVGAGVTQAGPLFAGGVPAYAWLTAHSGRGLFRGTSARASAVDEILAG